MASITSSIQTLFHSIWQILAGLAGSFKAVGVSIVALVQHIFQAIFAIFAAILNTITGLFGFVLGNIFVILTLGAAYWFWATQTASGQRKTAGGRKNPLK